MSPKGGDPHPIRYQKKKKKKKKKQSSPQALYHWEEGYTERQQQTMTQQRAGLSGPIFVVDPETLCDDASHLAWTHALGVPSVLLYVLGLPAVAIGRQLLALAYSTKICKSNWPLAR